MRHVSSAVTALANGMIRLRCIEATRPQSDQACLNRNHLEPRSTTTLPAAAPLSIQPRVADDRGHGRVRSSLVLAVDRFGDFIGSLFFVAVCCVLPTPLVICAIFGRGDIQAFAIGALVPWADAAFPVRVADRRSGCSILPLMCGMLAVARRRWLRLSWRLVRRVAVYRRPARRLKIAHFTARFRANDDSQNFRENSPLSAELDIRKIYLRTRLTRSIAGRYILRFLRRSLR